MTAEERAWCFTCREWCYGKDIEECPVCGIKPVKEA